MVWQKTNQKWQTDVFHFINENSSKHTYSCCIQRTNFSTNICLLGWGRQTNFNTTYWSLCMHHHHAYTNSHRTGHIKMKMWSSFTHPHVIPDWKGFISTRKTKGWKSVAHESYGLCLSYFNCAFTLNFKLESVRKKATNTLFTKETERKQSYSTAWKDMRASTWWHNFSFSIVLFFKL